MTINMDYEGTRAVATSISQTGQGVSGESGNLRGTSSTLNTDASNFVSTAEEHLGTFRAKVSDLNAQLEATKQAKARVDEVWRGGEASGTFQTAIDQFTAQTTRLNGEIEAYTAKAAELNNRVSQLFNNVAAALSGQADAVGQAGASLVTASEALNQSVANFHAADQASVIRGV